MEVDKIRNSETTLAGFLLHNIQLSWRIAETYSKKSCKGSCFFRLGYAQNS